MTQSAYIHIPFCKSKCKYCSFVSYAGCNEAKKKRYVETLLKEISFFYKKEPLKTLYIGGGTPTLLESPDIKRVLDCFEFLPDAEITVETNPETIDYDYLCDLKKSGVNRLSIGVQSFDDRILKTIGRIHSSKKAIETVDTAKAAGFSNISLDFIYGLPFQSIDGFADDLAKAVELGVSHISLYGLKIEKGCAFYTNPPKNIADEDLQADMYLAAIDVLSKAEFLHYEISNFCKDGKISYHNTNYWKAQEYYGFGAAAHGYTEGVRYSNFCSLEEYLKKYKQKEQSRKLTEKEKLEEKIFLGFRLKKGINVSQLNKDFCIDFETKYEKILKKYQNTGHIVKTENGYALTDTGFLLSNIVLSDFL